MFYHLSLSRTFDVKPKFFGPRLRNHLEETLLEQVEGKCDGKHGYIICVTKVVDISQGLIRQDGSGLATFTVNFTCIVLRPFKGEVVDCVVESVNKMGFFATLGPIQIFVSNHLIPEDFEFNSGETCFISSDQSVKIATGNEVRLRIVGVKFDANDASVIGSIREDYLGPIGDGS